MRGSGPIDGEPCEIGVVIAGSDAGVVESATVSLMGLDPAKIRHLRLAAAEGLLPNDRAVEWVHPPRSLAHHDFRVRRTALHRISWAVSRVPTLQRVVYHSAFSSVLYAIVRRIRGDSPQSRLSDTRKRPGELRANLHKQMQDTCTVQYDANGTTPPATK